LTIEQHLQRLNGAQWEALAYRTELVTMKEALDFSRAERTALEEELRKLRACYRDIERHVQEMIDHSGEVECLAVAAQRLLAIDSQEEAYRAVQDVVANIIGSEQTVLFTFNPAGTALRPVAWCGVDETKWSHIPTGEGLVGSVADSGLAFLGPQDASGITACVPFHHQGRVTGVLVILQMLPQKQQLSAVDHVVLDLLAKCVGRHLA
jgi:hypothetical protein